MSRENYSHKGMLTPPQDYDPKNLPPVEVLPLNVGGLPFMVTNYTLLTLEGSLLWELCNGPSRFAWDLKDKEGNYFFDRDPHLFSRILSLYRTGSAVVADRDCDAFEKELAYWRLWHLVDKDQFGGIWDTCGDSSCKLSLKRNKQSSLKKAIQDAGLVCKIFDTFSLSDLKTSNA